MAWILLLPWIPLLRVPWKVSSAPASPANPAHGLSPSDSYLLQRLKLSLYLGCMIVVWGVYVSDTGAFVDDADQGLRPRSLLLCMVVPRSFAGLAVIRTLLGAAEACVTVRLVLQNG